VSGSWRDAALCAGFDPELFFPLPGEDASGALAVCAACPARSACLAEAVAGPVQHGVWGGVTEDGRHRERRRAAVRRRRDEAAAA
jgi:WhiB family redox-sensing transcriptional regulator